MQHMASAFARLIERAYGVFAWTTLTAVSLTTIATLAVTPGLARRRAVVRRAARCVLRLTAARPNVRGLQNLPAEPCIVVANHASYLDGIILVAVLPPRFSFVIKREMTRVPLAHFLLRRIGSVFVERFDTRRGASDARRMLGLAEGKRDMAFFPEGTFRREPGLRRFQNGAFAAAARGAVPVVPVVIRGSRAMLPAKSWLPRPGQLEVIVKPPVRHNGVDDPVPYLRSACRQSILADLAEPDLGRH
jgi:1-acyl-sn-glycerol-3-phosphate acyltransferase